MAKKKKKVLTTPCFRKPQRNAQATLGSPQVPTTPLPTVCPCPTRPPPVVAGQGAVAYPCKVRHEQAVLGR